MSLFTDDEEYIHHEIVMTDEGHYSFKDRQANKEEHFESLEYLQEFYKMEDSDVSVIEINDFFDNP